MMTDYVVPCQTKIVDQTEFHGQQNIPKNKSPTA